LKVLAKPALGFGEAYMDGEITLERGSLSDLFELANRNLPHRRKWRVPLLSPLSLALRRRLQQWNSRGKAKRNAAHHYDLSETLFRGFLDRDLQYSCAYFRRAGLSLEAAQQAKKRHIMAKLALRPGLSVLDIGSGWGGLALDIARSGARVTGITPAAEQIAVARQRAAAAGLSGTVTFEPRDYREIDGPFDRIVSVGMFEHVGAPNYPAFFRTIARLLNEEGVALIHAIGRSDGPGTTDAWTRKYIFPGGYIPALSEVVPAVERAGLFVADLEILRLHYAETLRHWRQRFLAQREAMKSLYDERFCRMWELYLAGSEMAFRHGGLMVFQLQLARRVDALPLTRDYIYDREQALGAAAE
ncbi:MAG TPA: cyclopropane-fatty-acyl-phospholipid synthase family protein, partial [Stellaceae bacterium]|nr:cyclopropane-fatty-acyl-phospholipid synthase family protein [Stellaceae bacterium]